MLAQKHVRNLRYFGQGAAGQVGVFGIGINTRKLRSEITGGIIGAAKTQSRNSGSTVRKGFHQGANGQVSVCAAMENDIWL